MLRELFINVSILVTLTTVGAALVNITPERPTRWWQLALQWVAAVICGLTLLQFPVRLADGVILAFHAMGPALAGFSVGPVAGVAVALPLAAYRLWMDGFSAFHGGVNVLVVGLVAGLLRAQGRGLTLNWRSLWWRVLAVFATANSTVLLLPVNGPAVFRDYYVGVTLAHSAGVLLAITVIRTRFDAQMNLRRVTRLAHVDHLTGLPNVRALEQAVARYSEADKGCLLLLDLDNFKRVNDTYGHLTGDEVLRRVAKAMLREVRAGDLLCRYGGEEFAVLMHNCSLAQATLVAERLRTAVYGEWVDLGYDRVRVTVSGGLVPLDPAGSYDEQFATADRLLYRAKEFGRNRVMSPANELDKRGVGD